MKAKYSFVFLLPLLFLFACTATRKTSKPVIENTGTIKSSVIIKKDVPAIEINTKGVKADQLVSFAKTLLGIPYHYGSMVKEKGFDCSGFINYVFGHFRISVPRISWQFTNAGIDIPIEYSKPGDLILFTGSDAHSGIVGHMGIITENDDGNIRFIHASTSKGVVISQMNSYYIPRYVKVNRIFLK